MDSRFDSCLEEGKLVKIAVQKDLVEKELEAAKTDLQSTERSLKEGDSKWATVQAYYVMFHAAKALVLSKGYREKSHLCLSVALKVLFVDANVLERRHYDRFRDCMDLRKDADYGLIYSEKSADEVTGWAREFLEEARRIVK